MNQFYPSNAHNSTDFSAAHSAPVIVFGVGALHGIGAQCALRYAKHQIPVVIVGRTPSKLDIIKAQAQQQKLDITSIICDCTKEQEIVNVFDLTAEKYGKTAGLVHYNTGNNMWGKIVDMPADYFRECWELCAFGGFIAGRETVSRLEAENRKGTLLYTGASASLRGRANFGAFNSAKAALRNMAMALAKEAGPKGIHVGHVIVDGGVDGEMLHTKVPKYHSENIQKMISIQGIVDGFEFMWQQPNTALTFELDVRTSTETW